MKSVVVAPLNNQTMIKRKLVTLTQSPPPLKSRGNMVETIPYHETRGAYHLLETTRNSGWKFKWYALFHSEISGDGEWRLLFQWNFRWNFLDKWNCTTFLQRNGSD